MATEIDCYNENATLHETIRNLERENRRLQGEADRACRTVHHLRNTIDTLERTIIAQARVIDIIMPDAAAADAQAEPLGNLLDSGLVAATRGSGAEAIRR